MVLLSFSLFVPTWLSISPSRLFRIYVCPFNAPLVPFLLSLSSYLPPSPSSTLLPPSLPSSICPIPTQLNFPCIIRSSHIFLPLPLFSPSFSHIFSSSFLYVLPSPVSLFPIVCLSPPSSLLFLSLIVCTPCSEHYSPYSTFFFRFLLHTIPIFFLLLYQRLFILFSSFLPFLCITYLSLLYCLTSCL